MTRFLAALAAVVLVLTAVTLHAKELKQVYLRDGSIVEAQSVRKSGDTVTVTVNRDVVVDFPADQVDLKKTFPAKPHKAVKKHRRHRAYPKVSRPEKKATAPAPASAAAVPGKPGGAAPAAAVPGKPGSAPAASPAKQGTPPPAAAGKPAPAKPVPPIQGKTTSAKGAAAKPAAPAVQKPGTPPPAAAPAIKPAAPAPPPLALKPVSAPPAPPQTAPAPPPAMAAAVAGFFATYLVVMLAIIVIMIASFWKIFTKAGEPGWKSLIPIYNLYVLISIAGRPGWWFVLCLIPIVQIIVMLIVFIDLAKRFDKHPFFGAGLFFLGFIFFPILAFDSSTYR